MNSSKGIGVEFQVQGLAELRAKLTGLAPKLQNNLVRGALRAGAAVIAEEARNRAPMHTGQLKASIRVSTRVINGRPVALVKAGDRYRVFAGKGRATKNPYRSIGASGCVNYHAAFYAHFIEFGTSKMAAKPFLRPAFEAKKEPAVEAFAEYLRQRLAQLVEG